jgi:hypothetical protein
MSERNTTKNLTPPIRSIAAGASSIIQSDEMKVNSKSIKGKIRDRSSSSSSSISTSSSLNSSTTHSLNRHTDDDDFSSIDEINPELAQLQLRLQTLRRLSKSKHFSKQYSSIHIFQCLVIHYHH